MDRNERFVRAMLRGDGETLGADQNLDLALDVAAVFHQSKRVGAGTGGGIPLSPNYPHSATLDVIMQNCYPAESLDMSVARVAKAAEWIGFQYLSPFSAAITYVVFPHLSNQPYKPKKIKGNVRQHQ